MFTLVLGGARSGKSRYALTAAESAADAPYLPLMIATAQAFDDEMRDRINRHREEREGRWRSVEAPFGAAAVIGDLCSGDVAVLDCLTLWLSNLMLGEKDITTETNVLIEALVKSPARLWLVANEVGMGIVPENALARAFRDEAGRLNQRLAAAADEVVFIAAGLPLRLKPQP